MAKLNHSNLEDPVLSHMTREFIYLRDDQCVREAMEHCHCRGIAQHIIYFYVTDEQKRLIGVVPTRRLLMSKPDEKISSIMLREIVSVPIGANVQAACELFYKYRYLALPVVDEQGRLEGMVDISALTDAMVDVNRKYMYDDIFQIIGVHLAAARKRSPLAAFKNRFPWLLCNIAGGLMCAFVVGMYEKLLDYVIILALFIPVVLALGESVSMQSMTITLQRLHRDIVNRKYFIIAVRNEFITSFLLGIGSGALVGLAAWLWRGELQVSLAIGYSIFFSIMTACILGVVIPMAVHVFNKDPKVASGPLILTVADIATLLLYLNIAGTMLR